MYKARLHERYVKIGRKLLQDKFEYKNVMQIPKLEKIVINMGIKEAVNDSKVVEQAASELMLITGQKAVMTKAKKSIAGFKLREGMNIGCKVTLRKHIMYEFLDKLVNVAMPRIRDFRGISAKNFDGRGNFSVGLKEQLIFPEINYDQVGDKIRGMNVVIVTTANTDLEAKALLEIFNIPFIN